MREYRRWRQADAVQLTRPSIEDRHDERGQWVIVRVDNSLKKAAWAVLVLVGAGAIATQFPWAALTSTNPFERIFFYCVATLFIAIVAFCVLNLAWVLAGTQLACICERFVTLNLKIGMVPVRRARSFTRADVREVNSERRERRARGGPFVRYAITFMYHGRREDMFVNLTEGQADALLAGPLRDVAEGS